MAANDKPLDVKGADIVETEITKGEQNDVLEEYSQSEIEKIKKKPHLTKVLTSRTVERSVPQAAIQSTSARIKELARPTKQRVLSTLHERGTTLPPTFVDNLIRIIEAKSCLTPEEAVQVIRRKKRKTKITQFPSPVKKWVKEITKDVTRSITLDRDATMCQYLMAERLVRSILGYQCRTQKKNLHEIADVILKRLTSVNGYADAQKCDRAMQQLHLLADTVACWIVEILIEVAEIRKEALEEYCTKMQMKMMEVDDNDQTDSETEYWKQIKSEKRDAKQEEEKNETEKESTEAGEE